MLNRNHLLFIAAAFTFFSCAEEDAPVVAKISFEGYFGQVEMPEGSVSGIVDEYGPGIFLSKPLENHMYVYLEPSGAAVLNEDYTLGNYIMVEKGKTFAAIDLRFINDDLDEHDEPGVLRISSVEDPNVSVDTASVKFLIRDDDVADLHIALTWAPGGNTGLDHIDMDLYLWRETSPGSNVFEIVKTMATRGVTVSEHLTLSGLDKDGLYALSCVYYSGNTDNFTFGLHVEPVGSATLEGGRTEFRPTYDIKNINQGPVLLREVFFTKEGFHYKNLSPFVVPESGS